MMVSLLLQVLAVVLVLNQGFTARYNMLEPASGGKSFLKSPFEDWLKRTVSHDFRPLKKNSTRAPFEQAKTN